MLLRRLPATYEGRTIDGDKLVIRFKDPEPTRSPRLWAQIRASGGFAGGNKTLSDPVDGIRTVEFPLPPEGTGALELLLRLPESAFVDTQIASFRSSEPDRLVGDERAPGLFVLALDPLQDLGREVASLPGVVFPPNDYRFVFRNAEGRVVSGDYVVRVEGIDEVAAGGKKPLRITKPLTDADRVRFVFQGAEPSTLWRVEAWSAQYFVFDLEMRR
jgi:hypothetical protein